MNGHFPDPYPDELVYSVLARLGTRIGHLNWQEYGGNILGAKTATGIIDLPNRLEVLACSLPAEFGVSADQLIDKNTLWPYYAAFLPHAKRSRTRDEMKGVGQLRITFGLISFRGAKNNWLRYCPECAKNDRRDFGETYWHRSHQIPGAMVCAEHNILLVDSSIAIWHRSNRHAYFPAETAIPRAIADCPRGTDLECALATDSLWLLEHPELEINTLDLKDRYISRLTALGLANRKGNIQMEDLHRQFVDIIGRDMLNQLGSCVPDSARHGYSWLASALRNPNRTHAPIRHILILRFLQIDVRTIHLPMESSAPFGRGPWPCLNHVSEHFGLRVIGAIEIAATNNGRSLRAVFPCSECGMVYERLGPDKTEADQYRRNRIPIYGLIWEERLKELWPDRSVSLRGLSRQLGVDPHSVIRQVKRLRLHDENTRSSVITWDAITSVKPPRGPRRNPAEYKEAWASLRKAHPSASTTELRKQAPGTYAFLRRHEKNWLEANLPHLVAIREPTSSFDWDGRDDTVSQLVISAVQSLVRQIPPVRLTVKAMLTQAGWPTLTRKNLYHMKQTQAILMRYREDQFLFAVRRVHACATRLKENGQLSYRRLLGEANLSWGLLRNRSVQGALFTAMSNPKSLEDPQRRAGH